MVVKSATKKKLMDLGVKEEFAHRLSDDRKWKDHPIPRQGLMLRQKGVSELTVEEIMSIIHPSTEPDSKEKHNIYNQGRHLDELWDAHQTYAQIHGLSDFNVPVDLGICNHTAILWDSYFTDLTSQRP